MQEKMTDGTYGKPEPFDVKKLEKSLLDEKVEKVIVFNSISKEMRRAWRRFEKKGKIKRGYNK